MRRPDKPNRPADEPLLFDLPLASPDEPPLRPARGTRGGAPPVPPAVPEPPARKGPIPVPAPEPGAATVRETATRGRRFAAGLADLLVHAAIGVTALIGIRWMGVRAALSDWPALALFLVSFSFLYVVLPLAFWGYTLGMAWAGLMARNRDGEPLTFDQTARRWLGGLLTVFTLGVPLLAMIRGRSLADWISGSVTYPEKVE